MAGPKKRTSVRLAAFKRLKTHLTHQQSPFMKALRATQSPNSSCFVKRRFDTNNLFEKIPAGPEERRARS
jgi:hypothetical protein